jgi:hypothetical protein
MQKLLDPIIPKEETVRHREQNLEIVEHHRNANANVHEKARD